MHIQNLKPMPVAHGVVDTCMECGFCESACPSGHVTLTPRQRIVATRELARLDMGTSADDAAKAAEMRTIYGYQALDTCAADGMCAEKCPVSINTGRMVKDLRARSLPPESFGFRAGAAALSGFGPLMGAVPPLLNLVDTVHGVLGTRLMAFAAGLVGPVVGLHWHPYLARGAAKLSPPKPLPATLKVERKKVRLRSAANCIAVLKRSLVTVSEAGHGLCFPSLSVHTRRGRCLKAPGPSLCSQRAAR